MRLHSRSRFTPRLRESMAGLHQDVRLGVRRLRQAPGFTLSATVTLALGMAGIVLVFTVVNGILLRPLPYADANRLVAVFLNEEARQSPRAPTSPVAYLAWREASRTLETMTAAHPWAPSLTGRERPDELRALKATPSLFTLLGVAPHLGRGFEADDERGHVVVLGFDLWQRRFGADPSIVGQTLTLDGEPYEVIGVMPKGFRFPPFWASDADMWAPLVLTPEAAQRHARYLRVFARLSPTATLERARAELDTIGPRLIAQYPEHYAATSVTVEPLHEPVVAGIRPTLLLLLAAVALLGLIACANVANLQLVRASSRTRERAVQSALGASALRLVRQQVAESAILAVMASGVGTLLAAWGMAQLVRVAPANVPRVSDISVDASTLACAAVLAALVTLVLGVTTATWRGAAADLLGSRSRTAGTRDTRLRNALVVWQVAAALVLLVAAGLVSRSLLHLQALDPGFRREGVTTMAIGLAGSPHAAPARQPVFLSQAGDAVAALPGVSGAAFINHLPIGGDLWGMGFMLEGSPLVHDTERPRANFRVVTPGYFAAMGIPMLGGRDFTRRDEASTERVAVVNRTLADRVASAASIVGRRLSIGAPGSESWLTVVGVVGDVRQGSLADDLEPELFFPYTQNPVPTYLTTTLVVRSEQPASVLQPAVERAVWSTGGELPITNVRTVERILAEQVESRTFGTRLAVLFALVALTLSAVGIYGVISYTVGQRTREIGVRAALGAERGDIMRLVMRRGLILASAGLLLGLGGAVAAARALESVLFGVRPLDPLVLSGAAFALAATALAAAYAPARRAARLDPLSALRSE